MVQTGEPGTFMAFPHIGKKSSFHSMFENTFRRPDKTRRVKLLATFDFIVLFDVLILLG